MYSTLPFATFDNFLKMKSTAVDIVVSFAIIVAMLNKADATISCYVCNTTFDIKCADYHYYRPSTEYQQNGFSLCVVR